MSQGWNWWLILKALFVLFGLSFSGWWCPSGHLVSDYVQCQQFILPLPGSLDVFIPLVLCLEFDVICEGFQSETSLMLWILPDPVVVCCGSS